ncbi:hypothetical protein JCM3765_004017 [Sporobolomyces pararoseus]
MPQAPQTILSTSSEPLPSLSSISLLPCSLAFDGPAPISTYFHPRPYLPESSSSTSTTPTESEENHRQAAFRGRRLISSFLSLPQGYRGLVFSTKAAVPPRATEDEMEAELESIREEKNRKAREERAAKRAKLATNTEGETGSNMRRSPRKAAQVARERAIKAAKEKAKGKGKGANKFSLDDSDEEEEEKEVEQPEPVKQIEEELEGEKTEAEEPGEGAEEEMKMQIEETISSTTTITEVIPTTEASVTDETTLTSEATLVEEETSTPAETPLVPAPAPLLTRTSTSLSTHLHLPTTPSATIVSEPSFSLPTELAKDEKHLNPVSTFSKIEVWNPDFMIPGGKVEEEDEVARSVKEWIGLANKIHTY